MNTELFSKRINTPLGSLLAVGDEKALYMIEFITEPAQAFEKVGSSSQLARKLQRVEKKTKKTIREGSTDLLVSFEQELNAYFAGNLTTFKTPLAFLGSPFQNMVWEHLRTIPFGATCSYADLAHMLKKPTAFRAVARANATNLLPIVIPCHRVINKNGNLGGYNGGLERKEWLIRHEKQGLKRI